MRFSLSAVALLPLVLALSPRQDLPNCAITCLSTADYGSCNSSDYGCLCKSDTFIEGVASCFQSTCSGNDLTSATALSQQLCLQAGVTITQSLSSASSTSPATSDAESASATGTNSDSDGAASLRVGSMFALSVATMLAWML